MNALGYLEKKVNDMVEYAKQPAYQEYIKEIEQNFKSLKNISGCQPDRFKSGYNVCVYNGKTLPEVTY